jgi:hypothetical protein
MSSTNPSTISGETMLSPSYRIDEVIRATLKSTYQLREICGFKQIVKGFYDTIEPGYYIGAGRNTTTSRLTPHTTMRLSSIEVIVRNQQQLICTVGYFVSYGAMLRFTKSYTVDTKQIIKYDIKLKKDIVVTLPIVPVNLNIPLDFESNGKMTHHYFIDASKPDFIEQVLIALELLIKPFSVFYKPAAAITELLPYLTAD